MARPAIMILAVLGLITGSGTVQAQAGPIEELARVLSAEDARLFDGPLLQASLRHPDPLVRRTSARAIGRIGDFRGTSQLTEALLDPDTTVQTTVLFALGILRDRDAVPAILRRLNDIPALAKEPALEAVVAVARLGGPAAAGFLSSLLRGAARINVEDPEALIRPVLGELWRLGGDAPVDQLVAAAENPANDGDLRWRALFSLARLRSVEAAQTFMAALNDKDPAVRVQAAGVLTPGYVSRAGLDPASVRGLLERMLQDQDNLVRIEALATLEGHGDTASSPAIIPWLDHANPNVRLQAAEALASTGGPAAAAEFQNLLQRGASLPLERLALIGLARNDRPAFVAAVEPWNRHGDWRHRAAAAEAWAEAGPGNPAQPDFLEDLDPRVVAAALRSRSRAAEADVAGLASAARPLLSHPDAAVRAAAAGAVGKAASTTDIDALVGAFRRAERDSFPDAAVAALAALQAIAEASDAGRDDVVRGFVAGTSRPDSYVMRMWAEDQWPDLATRWGPAFPLETELSLNDYRAVARRFLVNQGEAYPHVFVETEQNGVLELELFGPDAPLTVVRFLSLVDRRFFDGQRWRAAPGFVLQAGDPRGDGWGSAPGTVRDEINRRRFGTRSLGLSLAGPETGSSQWFVTLSPQPQLDARYTVFGEVVGRAPTFQRITQGDRIKAIHR